MNLFNVMHKQPNLVHIFNSIYMANTIGYSFQGQCSINMSTWKFIGKTYALPQTFFHELFLQELIQIILIIVAF